MAVVGDTLWQSSFQDQGAFCSISHTISDLFQFVFFQRVYVQSSQTVHFTDKSPAEPSLPGQMVARSNLPARIGPKTNYFRCSQQIQRQVSNAGADGIL